MLVALSANHMAATQCVSACRWGDFQRDIVAAARLAGPTVSPSDQNPKGKIHSVSRSRAEENGLVGVMGQRSKKRPQEGKNSQSNNH